MSIISTVLIASLIAVPFQAVEDNSVAGLLHRDDVQTELKLTPAQLKKWDEVDRLPRSKPVATFTSDPLVLVDPDSEAKREAEREAKAWSILGPSQTLRLMELYIQRNGYRTLLRSDLQNALAFTEEQRASVRRAKTSRDLVVRDLIKRQSMKNSEAGRPDLKKMRDRLAAAEKQLVDELDLILDQEQRNQFATMAGKKFVFATRVFR